MKRFLILILLGASLCASAQSPRFKLGKWTEIQTAILQELNRSYVDSLPIDRIERRGIDAMLADLDPYTVFIPEEENENLQMMIHKSYGGIGAVIYKPDPQGNVIINEPYAGSPAAKNGLVCGDEILAIDGETVLSSVYGTRCATLYGTNELAAGWHTFRQIASDFGGDFGGVPTMGYNTDGSSTYVPFSVANVTMRPAANDGDPDNANTVRWSHYKGTEATVGDSSTSPALWNKDFDWDFRCITNNIQMIQGKGGATSAQAPYMNGYTVNRFEGWFLVTEENADKEWTFRSQYDDRCGLWLDGVDTGLTGTSGNSLTYKVTLARGWHSFRIQIADFAGDAGPWDTSKPAISYQVAGGAQTQFSEATLQLTVCPDGYVQGGVTLASGARIANGAAENAATVFGDVTATGTGATLAGKFKFAGGTLAFRNVAPNTADLASVLAFENSAADMLADVGAITVDYVDKPTRGRIPVCPLYGLTEEAAKAKISVTVAGAPAEHIVCTVENGNITLRNTSGTVLFFR